MLVYSKPVTGLCIFRNIGVKCDKVIREMFICYNHLSHAFVCSISQHIFERQHNIRSFNNLNLEKPVVNVLPFPYKYLSDKKELCLVSNYENIIGHYVSHVIDMNLRHPLYIMLIVLYSGRRTNMLACDNDIINALTNEELNNSLNRRWENVYIKVGSDYMPATLLPTFLKLILTYCDVTHKVTTMAQLTSNTTGGEFINPYMTDGAYLVIDTDTSMIKMNKPDLVYLKTERSTDYTGLIIEGKRLGTTKTEYFDNQLPIYRMTNVQLDYMQICNTSG